MGKIKDIEMLLVEDNDADVILIQESLSQLSLHPILTRVDNGEAAINYVSKKYEYADAKTPNVILLDINLPKQSGIEVLKFIRSDESLKHIPVIMLSTSGIKKDIIQSYALGANSYLIKPMDFNEFMDCIKMFSDYWFNIISLPIL